MPLSPANPCLIGHINHSITIIYNERVDNLNKNGLIPSAGRGAGFWVGKSEHVGRGGIWLRGLTRLLFAVGVLMPTVAYAATDLGITSYSFTDPTARGSVRTFTVIAANLGSAPINDAVITITASSDFTVDPSSLSAALGCTLSGSIITCTPSSLPVGSTTITYNATANTVGSDNTVAQISSVSAADPVSTNNSLTKAATVRQGADLSTTMTDGVGGTSAGAVGSAPGGSSLTYQIVVTNAGPDTTNQITVTDDLPPTTDFTSTTPTNCGTNWTCVVSGAQVVATYNGATAIVGTYPTITITGKVITSTSGGLTNNVNAAPSVATIIDPDGTGHSQVSTNITPGTDLAAGKTMAAFYSVGATNALKIRVTNVGFMDVTGATVTDTIDPSLSIGSPPSGCSKTGQTVTCTAGTVSAGGGFQEFTIPVTGASLSGGTLTNTATVAPPAGFVDPVASNNSKSVTFQVLGSTADLSIDKVKTPNPVSPGGTMVSTITVTNNGPASASIAPANPLRVIDDLGPDETFVSFDAADSNPTTGWNCTSASGGSLGGQRVTCTLANNTTISPGNTRKVVLKTQASATASGPISNTACTGESAGAGGTTPTDLNTANDCETVGSNATTTHSNLTIVKEASEDGVNWAAPTVIHGTSNSLYLRLTVTNAVGADTAPTVTVTDDMTPNNTTNGYSLIAGFPGPAPVLSASSGSPSWNSSSHVISWTFSNLAAGQSQNMVAQFNRPLQDGTFTNTANVASPDSVNLNATPQGSATYKIDPVADLTVTANTLSPSPAKVGVISNYTISVKNTGPSTATDVVLTDTVDPTKFVLVGTASASGAPGTPCTSDVSTGTFSCTFSTMILNASNTITQQIRPLYPFGGSTNFTPPPSYTNTATVSASSTDLGPNPNSKSLTHTVNGPSFDIAITNGEPDSTYDPIGYGPDLTYDIHVTNVGPSRANDIQALTVPLPPSGFTMTYHDEITNPSGVTHGSGIAYATNTANAGCQIVGGNLLCRIDQTTPANNWLDPATDVVFRVHFTPGGATPPTTPLTFKITSQITATEQPQTTTPAADSNLANNANITETTTVLPTADLEVVSKTPGVSQASANEPILYTIVLRNNGTSGTTQVRLTDTLPSGLALFSGFTPVVTSTSGGASVGTMSCSTVILCILDGSFPSGGTVTLQLKAIAAYPYSGPIGTNLTNTATISPGLDGGGNPLSTDNVASNNSKTANVQIVESSISGTVFLDANNNNVADSGEGLGAVTVTLNGTDNWGNTIPTLTTTSAPTTGIFTFDHLPAGTYTIVETQPGAVNDGRETAGTSGGTVDNSAFDATATHNSISAISLAANTAATGYLFQELSSGAATGSINGRVFKDPQRDGIDSGGEPGIVAVTVTLKQGATVVATTTTAADGSYSFSSLTPGSYSVVETQPAGYGSSSPDTVSATVTAGGVATVNFADTVSTIAGSVYVDASGDGLRQAGETGIHNVTVTLTGTDAAGAAVHKTATTDANGDYTFSDLLSGTYTLTETQPAAYADGLDHIGSVGGTTGNDVLSAIPLPAGVDATGYLFGEQSVSVTGTVYVDTNLSGAFDSSDTPLAGVAVALQTPGGAVIATTTTNANGTYRFDNVGSGTYVVAETQPVGYGSGPEHADNLVSVTVAATTPAPINFGERTGSIAGLVYNDSNNNGQRDPTEPPIAGVAVRLSGIDANGLPVSRTTVSASDGSFKFSNVVGGSYALTETQPAGYDDGLDSAGTAGGSVLPPPGDTISGIALGAAQDATSYLFGERGPGANLSGSVWYDANHDGVRNSNEPGKVGWTVQLLQGGTLIASTTTDSNGEYKFTDLPPGAGYALLFREPTSQAAFGSARPNETGLPASDGVVSAGNPGGADFSTGQIRNLNLAPGANVQQQSLPLDPSGVVYDSVTRQVVPGATVKISGPAGFDPSIHLLGGAINANQTVGTDGAYQFLLIPGAPNGVYTLTYAPPATGAYSPATPSTRITVCPGTYSVGSTPDPMLISTFDGAPPESAIASCTVGLNSTAYYLSFALTAGVSANVVNNNLPLDPILKGAIVVTKTTPMRDVTRGGLVPYTITAKDVLSSAVPNVAVTDLVPAGFTYRTGTARMNGIPVTPVVNGRLLTFPGANFAAGETKTYDLMLTVGAGVGDGEHVNQAWAVNVGTNTVVSNVAEATVRIEDDADFDCTDILGKVFDDKNGNGVQDQGEPGLPGVRLVTVAGDLITTDAEGRYHITCPMIANAERGSNFIVKLDTRTLPTGYRVTTDNPETVRLTQGKFVKLNFGAALLRVVRLDVLDAVFKGEDVAPEYLARVDSLIATLEGQPSVLRITYTPRGEEPGLVHARMAKLKAIIEHKWAEKPRRCRLIIEAEESW